MRHIMIFTVGILLFIVILMALNVCTLYEPFNEQFVDFHIVCATHDRNTSFLDTLDLSYTILGHKDTTDIPNKGGEGLKYLYYIIKNYDSLPKHIIFIHDHDESWHHRGKISENMNRFIQEYIRHGRKYYNFNSIRYDFDVDIYRKSNSFRDFWDNNLLPRFGTYEDALLANSKDFICCAQFIVSRETIQAHPIEFYKRLYDWIVVKTTNEGIGKNTLPDGRDDPYASYHTGRFIEWVWELIFRDKVV